MDSKTVCVAVTAAATGALLWKAVSSFQPSSDSATSDLELFYFDIEGKAEPIRLAAAKGGPGLSSFKDTRLSKEAFEEMQAKGTLASGQVPALKVNNGEFLTQSAAILKFVGKQVGLYPSNNVLAARVDALLDFEVDFFMGLTVSRYPWRFGFDAVGVQGAKDRSCKTTAKVRAELNSTILPKQLGHLEAILAKSPTGWLAGTAGPTVADLVFAPRLCWMLHENDGINPNLLDGFPKVANLIRKVYGLDWIKAYYSDKGRAFDSQALKLGPKKA